MAVAEQRMKAAVYRKYGGPDVVHLEQCARPVPQPGEVLIRVHATTVSSGDARIRALRVPRGFGLISRLVLGWNEPRTKILGNELSGVVAALGEGVSEYAVGDRVVAFVWTGASCHAEYRAVPVKGCLSHLPDNVTFEQGAALAFGGTTALHFLRDKARLRRGEKLLVIGASGTVGSAMVQLGKHWGAHVVGVTSTQNSRCVATLGADRVVDYTRTKFLTGEDQYDVIAECVGNVGYSECRPALNQGGRLVLCAASVPQMLEGAILSLGSSHRVFVGSSPELPAHVEELVALAKAGAYSPLIDTTLPLERIAEAHARVDTGHKRGSVVVRMDS